MKDLHSSTLKQCHLMFKGATLEPDSLNPGFPRELTVGSGPIFLASKSQFLPPYNGAIDSICLKVVMKIK